MDDASNWSNTERLRLRPWLPIEADRLFDIRRRTEVAQWLGDPSPWTDLSTARQKIETWRTETLEPGPFGVWAIAHKAEAVSGSDPLGTVRLGRLPGSDEVEIGWYLHPDSGGQGFAVEAARAVLDSALAGSVSRVWAIMWPNNEPSARVAASIGMDDLGVIEDPWYGTEAAPTSRIFRSGSAN